MELKGVEEKAGETEGATLGSGKKAAGIWDLARERVQAVDNGVGSPGVLWTGTRCHHPTLGCSTALSPLGRLLPPQPPFPLPWGISQLEEGAWQSLAWSLSPSVQRPSDVM